MADSTTNLDLISSSQASKEITANALFDAESPSALFGRRASTTTALTWGYYGGRLLIAGVPTAISNGTLALTANTTNYVVAARTTGNVTASTANTNWNDTPNYMRLYQIVAGAATVTSYVDHRAFLVNDLAFSLGVDAGNAMQVNQAPQSWARLATTALGNTATNGVLTATGNNITTFTGTANVTYHVRATGNGLLVHSSTMNILQGTANITTYNGDTFDVEMITANTCYVKNYISARGGPVSKADIALFPSVASNASVDIFGALGATISLTGNVTVTGIVACTADQVGSAKTIIPSDAAGFSITATANIVVDGATSGTFWMPQNANIQIIATSTTTFKITTIEATGTWTATFTGFTTSPTSTFKFTKVGRSVLVTPVTTVISATSNATTKTATGMPTGLTPSDTTYIQSIVSDNGGARTSASARILTSGVIDYYKDADGNAFTASGTATLILYAFSYTL